MIEYLEQIVPTQPLSEHDQSLNIAYYRYGDNPPADVNHRFIMFVLQHFDALQSSRKLLTDDISKEIFDSLLLYRSLGYRYVQLFRNTEKYQAFVNSVENDNDQASIVERNIRPIRHKFLHRYRLNAHAVDVISANGFLINILFNRQYLFERGPVNIRPESGDVLLDCGACWGDTAVLFASLVGDTGQVLAFEFVKENLEIFEKNLALNPHLPNISVIEKALDDVSGRTVYFDPNHSGTSIKTSGSLAIQTITIDDAVSSHDCERVDYIKMDIEGSELKALKGAFETIKKHKPKLAISVYHKNEDFFQIPLWINAHFPDYRLYLDHHTIHGEETVLYAQCV